jgi:hypothetical protein
MKFAYLINAHKNAKQIVRLVDKLNNADTDFVIHVSKTSEKGFYQEITNMFKPYSNVYFCKREAGIHYGFGIVQATLNGMETLLKVGSEFDYFHLLSGQDYPLKQNDDIFDFFKKHNGKEFMYYWKMFPKKGEKFYKNHPWGKHRQLFRLNRFNFPWMGKTFTIPELNSLRLIEKPLFNTLKVFLSEFKTYKDLGTAKEEFWRLFFSRILPKSRDYDVDFEFYGGKTWFSFSKELINHIVQEHNNTPKWKKFFKYSLIPDESYFHTITMNSKFSDNVVNDYLREVEWEGGDGTHPLIWTSNDFERLSCTKNFWARKFEDDVDSEILDLIDSKLLRDS